ncbi:nucleolar protein 16 isoform X1 [Ambystoma mexicanum]|uniref:nucleolar protein 16 isoform X1 n=1 Tax=Ambystoma mexicanum TaxID=8296 RepID=UPI0037E7A5DD
MPKAKGANRRKKFNYTVNRKKLKRKSQRKGKPRIECEQIRNAWDDTKSVARNLAEMGLAVDPNQTRSIRKGKSMQMDVDHPAQLVPLVRKPYVLKGLQAVASLPEKSSKGISLDMIEYVRHMIENHGQNYKRH